MDKKQEYKPGTYTALGLIFGSTIGFAFAQNILNNIVYAPFGIGIGLIIGAIIDSNIQKKK